MPTSLSTVTDSLVNTVCSWPLLRKTDPDGSLSRKWLYHLISPGHINRYAPVSGIYLYLHIDAFANHISGLKYSLDELPFYAFKPFICVYHQLLEGIFSCTAHRQLKFKVFQLEIASSGWLSFLGFFIFIYSFFFAVCM